MNNKIWSIIVVAVLLAGFTTGYAWQNGYFHRSPQPKANVFIYIETPTYTGEIPIGNLITNIGEQYDRDILGYNNVSLYNTTTCISLGNTTTVAATLTKETTEATNGGFARQNGTVVGGQNAANDHYYNATWMFTSTADMNINSTGLHWSNVSNSDSNMFAVASLGAAYAFPTGSNCTIVWQIIIDAN